MKKYFKEEKTEYDKALEMVTLQMGLFVTCLVIGFIVMIIKSCWS